MTWSVAEVFPELVVYDEAGEPLKYHLLSSFLLNELRRLHDRVEAQDRAGDHARLEALEEELADLRARFTPGR